MKNIFILPTEKPSRLQQFEGIDEIQFELCSKDSFFNKGVHIYITSDEYIDKDSWVIHDNKLMYLVLLRVKTRESRRGALKIILTTDQDLIEDGVQAIGDDFLMWYIKNPSCKNVEVVSELKAFDKNGFCVSSALFEDDYTKNIYYIVPKVEPKENSTTTIFINKNRTIYNEDDLINFMQFIISQESLDNTSSVSKETARYYIEQFKNRQFKNK